MPQIAENKRGGSTLIELFRAFFCVPVHFRTHVHATISTDSACQLAGELLPEGLVDVGDAGGGADIDFGGRPGFEELFLAIDHGVDVVGGELEAVSVSDGVGGAGFDAIAAENAAGVVDVVDLGVTVGVGDAVFGGVLGGFDVNALRGASGGAKEAGDTLFESVFVALKDVNAAVARLKMDGLVRIVLRGGFAQHGHESDFEALVENFEGAEEFCDDGCHAFNLAKAGAKKQLRVKSRKLRARKNVTRGWWPVTRERRILRADLFVKSKAARGEKYGIKEDSLQVILPLCAAMCANRRFYGSRITGHFWSLVTVSLAGRGDRGGFAGALAAGDGGDDLAAVEASILDEDFAGVNAADEDSGDVDAGDVGFESFEIDARLARFGVEFDADAFEELEVGMIAGHGEGVEGGERFGARAVMSILDDDIAGLEAEDFGVEARGDFASADAIFDVWADPVFQRAAEFGAAMNEGDTRAAAKKIEGGFGGGIFCADDDDVFVPVRMRVGEIVGDVREIFAGDVEKIGEIVIAGGEDDFARVVFVGRAV
jgi:hypothetical protein